MIHQRFLNLLEAYRELNPNEEHIVAELAAHVASNQDCFERTPKENARHIAASVLLTTADYAKALFLWHAKIQRWTQPGGHADGDKNIQRVARKELEEETGITRARFFSSIPLDITRFDYASTVFGYRKSIYNLCFLAILPNNQTPQIMEQDKCTEMHWATPSEALQLIRSYQDPTTRRIIRKWSRISIKTKET